MRQTPRTVIRSRNRVYKCHLFLACVAVLVGLMVLAAAGDVPSAASGAFLLVFWLGIPVVWAIVVAVRETGATADKRLGVMLIGVIVLVGSWLFGVATGILEVAYVAFVSHSSWKWFRVERPALEAYLDEGPQGG